MFLVSVKIIYNKYSKTLFLLTPYKSWNGWKVFNQKKKIVKTFSINLGVGPIDKLATKSL